MRQLLSTVLAVHWAALFGLLAFFCAVEPHAAGADVTGLLGPFGGAGPSEAAGTEVAALLGLAFAMASSMFLWMLAECLLGRAPSSGAGFERSGRKAFAAAILALLLFLGVGALAMPPGQALLVGECLLVALLVSYLVVCTEQLHGAAPAGGRADDGDAARLMALGAAHQTMLSAMSGRAGEAPAGRL